jgi:hypothetical protein
VESFEPRISEEAGNPGVKRRFSRLPINCREFSALTRSALPGRGSSKRAPIEARHGRRDGPPRGSQRLVMCSMSPTLAKCPSAPEPRQPAATGCPPLCGPKVIAPVDPRLEPSRSTSIDPTKPFPTVLLAPAARLVWLCMPSGPFRPVDDLEMGSESSRKVGPVGSPWVDVAPQRNWVLDEKR